MSKKLVIIAGGRDYTDKERMREIILEERPTFIIEGDANGADRLAGIVAGELGVTYVKVPALWTVFGDSAGHRRNQLMANLLVTLSAANQSKHKLIAFPGGRGTKMMVSIAESMNIPVRKVDWE